MQKGKSTYVPIYTLREYLYMFGFMKASRIRRIVDAARSAILIAYNIGTQTAQSAAREVIETEISTFLLIFSLVLNDIF